ncbi:MAG: U32 family peptidase [Lachnospiraceae bacterium]
MMKKPEILAPAGSMEALKAAVGAGADAVYLGGSMFGARAYADNFDEQTLIKGIEYCHLYGVKVYLTVNTLFRHEEMKLLKDYLTPYYVAGLDAVIVQDLGVMKFIHDNFPDIAIHASTQMTITTPYAYQLLRDYGVTRVVPARELSNEELLAMKQVENPPELEVFVQGALCYCYSGQCLMSSFLGGRSGNRGRCAQPCRLPYELFDEENHKIQAKGAYLLSPKDLCGLSNVSKLMELGIDSFKIEGRMKKPLYVAACVRAYRNAVDACYENRLTNEMMEQYKKEMAAIFNRGGFTKGYFKQTKVKDMMSLENPGNIGVLIGSVVSKNKNQIEIKLKESVSKGDLLLLHGLDGDILLTCNVDGKLSQVIRLNAPKVKTIKLGTEVYCMQNAALEKELSQLISEEKRIRISGAIQLVTGQPAVLQLKYGNFCVEQTGKTVISAAKQPLTFSVVKNKISQLGTTRYELTNLEADISEDAFYSMKDLKELRRDAISLLEEHVISSYRREKQADYSYGKEQNDCNVYQQITESVWNHPIVEISSMEQFYVLNSYENVKDVYVDLQYFTNKDIIKLLNEHAEYNFYLVLPAILRNAAYQDMEFVLTIDSSALKGLVVRNIDEYAYLKNMGYKKEIVADYSLYVMNEFAGDVVFDMITLPVELNEKELMDLSVKLHKQQICVYGYQQLMVSAQCVCNHTIGCRNDNTMLILKDRYQKDFYCKSVCKYCYSIIYNGLPTVIYDCVFDDVKKSGMIPRLHFTIETKEEMKRVLDGFINNLSYQGKRTKGHFSRGVE